MDLQIVEWVQSFRNSGLDVFFSIVTEFGDETVFIIITSLLYWSVNKDFGYRFAMVFLGSVVLNDVLKTLIARPRPFNLDSVESVTEPTEGYSLPSGHAQNSTIQAWILGERFGSLTRYVRPGLVLFVLLVSFSRIYLGQHYLSDVIVGIGVASLYYLGIRYLQPRFSSWGNNALIGIGMGLLILMILFPEKNLWISVAGLVGGTIGYRLEQRFIQFNVSSSLIIHGLKFVLGISVTLGLQEGLKLVLPYGIDNELVILILDFIRYMLLVMWITVGAPALFKRLFKTKAA